MSQLRKGIFKLPYLPHHVFEGRTDGKTIGGFATPYFTPEQAKVVLRALKEAKPDLQFMAWETISYRFGRDENFCTVSPKLIDGMELFQLGNSVHEEQWEWEEYAIKATS